MKKKLLFAAVGAAILSAPAMADVKLYGRFHISLDNLERDLAPAAAPDTGEWFVSSNSSRFGIRAMEDIGGGMKAVGQAEFKIDNQESGGGTSGLKADRDSYLGVEAKIGKILLGNINSPTKDIGKIADLFYRSQLGEGRAITATGGYDNRIGDGIHYTSPSFAGLVVRAVAGVEDEFADSSPGADAKSTTDVSVVWSSGALSVGASQQSQEDGDSDPSAIRAGVKFDSNAFVVTGFFQSTSDEGGVAGADRDILGIGAAFKMDNNVFKAQMYQADDKDGTVAEDGGEQLAIGFDHKFSKTAIGYVTYATTSNDGNPTSGGGTFVVGGAGHGESAAGVVAGGDTSGLSIGMILDF